MTLAFMLDQSVSAMAGSELSIVRIITKAMRTSVDFVGAIMYGAFLRGVLYGKWWIANIYRHVMPALFSICNITLWRIMLGTFVHLASKSFMSQIPKLMLVVCIRN